MISIPVTNCGEKPYHHAQELAGGDERLKHEYLFEWKIPEKSVKHTVSVKTLLSRGLDLEIYLNRDHNHGDRLPSLQTVRSMMAEGISDSSIEGYDFGRYLAHIAQCFGARAPTQEIALRLLEDCPRSYRVMREGEPAKWQRYTNNFYWILDGIEEGLIDSWLADITFIHEFQAFSEWSDSLKTEVEDMRVDYSVDQYQKTSTGTLSNTVDENWQWLKDYEKNIDTLIEEEAVAIGL